MASVWLLPTLVSVIGGILVAVAIFVIIRMNTLASRVDIIPNAPLIDSTLKREFTNGYCLGVVKTITPCRNGTIRFEFFPLDSMQGENIPRPEMQTIIVGREFMIPMARGEGSARREMIKILSRNPADIPKNLRQTDEAKSINAESILAHMERNFGKTITVGDEATNKMLENISRVGLTNAYVARVEELLKKYRTLEAPTEKKEEEKK